jgi:hypothetical protein
MRPGNLVPSFYFYKLADALSSPYTALTAYSAGLIDAQGNVLKPESSIDPFEYLVIKLKKIFDQLPYGMTRARLGNYLSTLQMFSEEVESFDITQEQFHCLVEGFVTQYSNGELSYLELLEDMSTGGGAGALGVPAQGGDINQGGISGFDPPLGMPLQRRKQPRYFDNCEVFEVCPEEFLQLKAAKTWKEVPEGDTKNYLQRFQRRNKGGKIAVKSLNPLSAEHELHWITYPAKNFMEDVDVSFFSELLTETNDVDPDKFDGPDAGSKADSGEVAQGVSKEQEKLVTKGNRTMLTISIPKKTETVEQESRNAQRINFPLQIPKTKPEREKMVLGGITDLLTRKQFKQKILRRRDHPEGFDEKLHVEKVEDLKHKEFAVIPEGDSDIVVGYKHPKTGAMHHIGIESGFISKQVQKGYLIHKETKISIPKTLLRLTRMALGKNNPETVSVEDIKKTLSKIEQKGTTQTVDVEETIRKEGKKSSSGKRFEIYPVIRDIVSKFIKKPVSHTASRGIPEYQVLHNYLSKLTHQAIRTKRDDVSILGNAQGLKVMHHREQEHDKRGHVDELLKELDLEATHTLDETHLAKSPAYGGSTLLKAK